MTTTSFTSYWGNALMGIFVKWERNDTAATVSATTKLTATFDLKLYAAGTTPQTGSGLFETTNTMKFWLLILNPLDLYDYASNTNIVSNDMVGFDGVIANFRALVAGGDGSTDANKKTLEIEALGGDYTQVLVDSWC